MTEKKADFIDARWRKSTLSEGGGCVEVAYIDGKVGVRDTKDGGAGPILVFTECEWNAFLGGTAAGEFSIDSLSG